MTLARVGFRMQYGGYPLRTVGSHNLRIMQDRFIRKTFGVRRLR